MCGIVGYIGPKDPVEVLIEGLRRLEYRGYDSAGVAVVNGSGEIAIRRLPAGPVREDVVEVPLEVCRNLVAATRARLRTGAGPGEMAETHVAIIAEERAEAPHPGLTVIDQVRLSTPIVGAALQGHHPTGARLESKEPRVSLKAPIIVAPLVANLREQMNALGVGDDQIKNFDELASSDLGVVGYDYPTADLWFKIAPGGTALHSDALREAANSEEGWKATVTAGKAVALSACEMLTNPEKLEAVQSAFREMKAREGR